MSELENSEPDNSGTGAKGITRRTVTKSMAWAVPVIAVAATVPSAAASCIPTVTLSDRSCKCPGQSTGDPFTYFLELCGGGVSCPDSTQEIVVTKIVSVSNIVVYEGAFVVPNDGCAVLTTVSSNSAGKLFVAYTVGGVVQTPAVVDSPPRCSQVENPIRTCAA